ncbi:MAG: hypothetical protein M3O67_00900 [Bacteroidota bacterium]|nr:hypothetical protein [Bacteroidota bacterium]
MKKIIGITVFIFLMGFSSVGHAQVVQDVKHGAKKVGNKTAEVASKGKATVVDKKYKDKVGPNGQTIYIDGHSRYYWIDKKGHRHYVKEAELKARVRKED